MPARSTTATALAGALTVGAGLGHATAAADNAGQETAVVLFVVGAAVQVALGAAVLLRPSSRALVPAVAVNLAAAVAWAVSRTAGLPPVLGLGGREAVGAGDVATTVATPGGGADRGDSCRGLHAGPDARAASGDRRPRPRRRAGPRRDGGAVGPPSRGRRSGCRAPAHR